MRAVLDIHRDEGAKESADIDRRHSHWMYSTARKLQAWPGPQGALQCLLFLDLLTAATQ